MADLNKVMILGNVGRDPEIRYTANGSATTEFTVAANRNFRRPNGEWEKQTEWFTVIAWNKLAENLAQNLQKGDRVYVEGRLQTRSWDGQDGQKRYKTEVIADRVLPQGRRQQPAMAGEGGGYRAAGGMNGDFGHGDADMTDPDDLPFD